MRSQIKAVQVLLCLVLMLACHRAGSLHGYSIPPASSYRVESLSLATGKDSPNVTGAFVKPEFIKAVHAEPALGRFFSDEEYRLNGQRVAVISHHLWQQRYGANPAVIG